MLVSNLQLQLPKLELETLQELAGCLDSTIRVTGLSRPRQTDRQTHSRRDTDTITRSLACSHVPPLSLSLFLSLSLSLFLSLWLSLYLSLYTLSLTHSLTRSHSLPTVERG